MQLIKTLPENIRGRDFVIGDLHGSFNLLSNFLSFINFDKAKDRVIAVGDLVDRGPDNITCLLLLNEPWFHSVFGNHEELMQGFLDNEPIGRWWFHNGGSWWEALSQTEKEIVRNTVTNLVDELPFVITVNQANGKKFHVIHAELYSKVTDEDLLDETSDAFREALADNSSDGMAIIWGRSLFLNVYNKHMDEREVAKLRKGLAMHKATEIFTDALSTVYCGHNIVRQPTKIGGLINIDTGAFVTARPEAEPFRGLTITEPATGKFWLSNASSIKEAQLLVI